MPSIEVDMLSRQFRSLKVQSDTHTPLPPIRQLLASLPPSPRPVRPVAPHSEVGGDLRGVIDCLRTLSIREDRKTTTKNLKYAARSHHDSVVLQQFSRTIHQALFTPTRSRESNRTGTVPTCRLARYNPYSRYPPDDFRRPPPASLAL